MFRTRFNREKSTGIKFKGKNPCDQSKAFDVDINNIYSRYCANNIPMAQVSRSNLSYFSKPTTLLELNELNSVATAEFMNQPASLRAKFNNNPLEYYEFIALGQVDDKLYEQGVQLGLFEPITLEQAENPLPESISGGNSTIVEPFPENNLTVTGKGDTQV